MTFTPRKPTGRPPKNYDWATEYAMKVVSGEIIANKKNTQAAQRHLDDIENGVPGYTWMPDRATHVIKFIERLPDPKTGKPMSLMLFQKFIIASLYGWRDTEGNRRFTKAYISMARKQGKSLINSGIALYELIFGQSPVEGREIYVSSLTLRQAQTIYHMAYRQLNLLKANSKSLRQQMEMRKTDIVHIPSDSKFMALSNNPDAIDGKNPSVALLDELASMPDDEMYSRLKTGMALQENPLTVLISTASDNLNSPMYEEYKYVTKLLDGKVTNDHYFVYCAEMDAEAEVADESLWVKAMPLLENKRHRETILNNIRQDIEEQTEKGETTKILIKNFNLWQATSVETYISPDHWHACEVSSADITGTETYVGIDLARINDIAAISFAHIMPEEQILVDTHGFISTIEDIDIKSKRDKMDYNKLAAEGYITPSNSLSGIIDYEEMVDWLMAYEAKHRLNIKYLVYDNWDAEAFIQAATKKGAKWTGIQLSQSYKGMSPPTKQFRYAVFNRKIQHLNNPLLNAAMYNARVKHYDGNIKIDKNKQREKIDSLIALINAFSEAKEHEFKPMTTSEKIKSGKFSF